jgi:soluble lytic murein transglycosylase-like protein
MKRTILLAALLAAPLVAHADTQSDPSGIAPRVLSAEDVRLYREIFADEANGNFAAGRASIARLSDRSLLGYVEAEHYLSPYMHRPPVADLAHWLDEFAELPIAPRVREFAELRERHRRHKIGLAGIPAIPHRAFSGYDAADSIADAPVYSDAARAAEQQIAADVKLDQPAAADAVLQQLETANTASLPDVARLSQRVAAGYLETGQDAEALRVASAVTGQDREASPRLDWDAGLAAYRLGKYSDAAPYFETLAQSGAVPGWTRSAAAFWAARAYLTAGKPNDVISLLTAAAREQPTFYGLLAERLLGGEIPADFSEPVLDEASFSVLMQIPAAHRAVALWQVGRTDGLEQEMARAFAQIDLGDAAAFAALAHKLDLPGLELTASEARAGRGELLTGLFPVPQYTPPGGYHIDQCLLLAFARVESKFQARAVSAAGARGVMQVMPGTQKMVDGTSAPRGRLSDPSYSLGLGERFLQSLMEQTNGNLFELAAAYNAGPAALTRWLGTRPNLTDDPLLFIESVPYPETRNYIKHVMTYYWMYTRRMKLAAPTLDETAQGGWPLYREGASSPAGTTPAAPAATGTLVISDAH